MKILYYYEQFDSPMYTWQKDHFIDELSHHEISFTVVNPLKFNSIQEANNELLRLISSQTFDLFMTCHNEELLFIDTLRTIRSSGIPTLLICFDNLIIPFYHKKICKEFDLVWLTSVETKYLFDKWNCRNIFLPYAANPYKFKPVKCESIDRIVFLGTPYGSRANTINSLLENDVPVDIMGGNLKLANSEKIHKKYSYKDIINYSKTIYGRKIMLSAIMQKMNHHDNRICESHNLRYMGYVNDISEIYSKYVLALSSTAARNTGILKKPVPVINLRSFEIGMSGGIQFCKYNTELEKYYEDKKEIVFYHDLDDMVDKAHFYLDPKHQNLITKMKIKARERSVRDHGWINRFEVVFDILNINNYKGEKND